MHFINKKKIVFSLLLLRLKERDIRFSQSNSMENAGVDQTARIPTQSMACHQDALGRVR